MPFPEHAVTALLGQGCGDAFGCPFEYHEGAPELAKQSVAEGRYLDGFEDCRLPVRRCRTPGLYSDDTQQALVLLWIWSQLLARGHDPLRHEDVSELFIRVCARMANVSIPGNVGFGVHRGTGRNFRQVILRAVVPHTAGLGAAMRIGPVATLIPDRDLVVPWAVEVSRATTTHPVALAGAAMVALEAWCLAHEEDPSSVQNLSPAVGDDIRAAWTLLLDAQETLSGGEGPEALVAFAEASGLAEGPVKGPADGFALTGVPWVIHQARHAPSFESALVGVCSLGGDADTVAAMTGCLAALRFGREAIPSWMTEQVVGAEHLLDPDQWNPIQTEKALTNMDRLLHNDLERRLRERAIARRQP